jgi:Spy/CpxP family protein refolding chaperone
MLGAMAMAQTTPAAQAPVKAHGTKELIQAVDLTKAQQRQAKTILRATRQQARPLAQVLKQDRQSLTAAIQAGDTAQIQKLSAAVGTLTGQVLAVRSAGKAQFYALLTPDQKAKAAAVER